jgi:hypothetical protein
LEWRDLKDFILIPFFLVLDKSRERTSDHPTVKFAFSGSLPYPPDAERNDRDHYQGPWVKNDDTWRALPVQFQVEADDRTLRSWEAYQRENETNDNTRVVYSVMLPVVPKHPDKRTVVAQATVDTELRNILVTYDDATIDKMPDVTEALIAGAQKRPTTDFELQILRRTSTDSSRNMAQVAQKPLQHSDTEQPVSLVEELAPLPLEAVAAPRNYTPTPGVGGGPLNSHHEQPAIGRQGSQARPRGSTVHELNSFDHHAI